MNERSARLQHLPFRKLLLCDIFKKFNRDDFVKLKKVIDTRQLLPETLPFNVDVEDNDIANKCCEFLESRKYVEPDDVSVLHLLLAHARKPQLVKAVRKYEQNVLRHEDVTLPKVRRKDITQNASDFNTVLKIFGLLLGCVLVYIGPSVAEALFMVISGSYILELCIILVGVTTYMYYDDLKTHYHYLNSTRGCIPGSEMSFKFVTYDCQHPHVKNNVEFPFFTLQKKYPYLLKHPDERMRYFLNTNRSVNGGLRIVGSYLDKTPSIRGAEVFAMSSTADSVWYFHECWKAWMEYETAESITWENVEK